jgi:hypothetical protein
MTGKPYDSVKQPNPDSMGNKSRNGFLYSCYYNTLGIYFQEKVKGAILSALEVKYSKYQYSFEGEYLAFKNALYEVIRSHIQHDSERKQDFMCKVADILVYYVKNENDISTFENDRTFRNLVKLAYKGIVKYDKEAFVFDDVRLFKISEYLHKNIKSVFDDNLTLHRVTDIIIFLMKEDIYYRPRFIQILQDLHKAKCFPNGSTVSLVLAGLCELVKNFKLSEVEKANIERFH